MKLVTSKCLYFTDFHSISINPNHPSWNNPTHSNSHIWTLFSRNLSLINSSVHAFHLLLSLFLFFFCLFSSSHLSFLLPFHLDLLVYFRRLLDFFLSFIFLFLSLLFIVNMHAILTHCNAFSFSTYRPWPTHLCNI